jgi:hypothetical protein
MSVLREQLLRDRIAGIEQSVGIPADEAFERLIHSLITGESPHTSNTDDWVDGGQDKQIDIISIQATQDDADVHIIQAKGTASFSSNQLILMANGLDWIFKKSRKELATLANTDFRDKIIALRSTMNGLGYGNVRVHCYYACLGDEKNTSDEFDQEAVAIRATWGSDTFESFEFTPLGVDGLYDLITAAERKTKAIKADLKIRYDTNNPSVIKYQSQDLLGIVCTTDAAQIAGLVQNDKHGALFDSNIRRFLGNGKAVNTEILTTATDPASSYLFWFLNNGITIICDKVQLSTDPDNAQVRIENLQIVNGCQTASALAHASEKQLLRPDTRVLLKIFETTDRNLASKVVLTTNNQNRINARDLKSNDSVQLEMQSAFEKYGLLYEHKVNQYANYQPKAGEQFVSNELVGQAYLALILRSPSDARRRKYKIWSDLYSKIFTGKEIQAHIFTTLVSRYAIRWATSEKKKQSVDETKRRVAANGAFHIARVAASLFMGNDAYLKTPAVIEKQISKIKGNPSILDNHFQTAFNIILSQIANNPVFSNDLDAAFKATLLDEALTAHFWPGKKLPVPSSGVTLASKKIGPLKAKKVPSKKSTKNKK